MTDRSGSATASPAHGAGGRGSRGAMVQSREPGYLHLFATGELVQRARLAHERLAACDLCPRVCGVNRLAGQVGYCRAGAAMRVASHNVHHWEEPPISGTRGSGTIFFSYCTARCQFCQNYPISQFGVGRDVSPHQLAGMMLNLQRQGCHNINLVTPSHYAAQIVEATAVAARQGLCIPLLWNTNGYDRVETLRLLEGVVDIYLPDSKYTDDTVAFRLSGLRGYVATNRAALTEMRRQVGGDLLLDDGGIALRGMIVRHLVLPNGLSQTPEVLRWIAESLGTNTWISLMSQYFPTHKTLGDAMLGRRLTAGEYDAARAALDALGLEQGWCQELDEDDPAL